MANKPIISIDVDDTRFKRFKSLFDSYQTALKKLPGAWGAQGAAIGTTAESFIGMSAALMAQNELLHKNTRETEKQKTLLDHIARTMKDIGRSSSALVKDITGAVGALVKFIPWAVGGAALGAFGVDRLALSVARTRQGAIGIGASYGGLRSFENQFGPNFSAGSYLGNVSEVLADRTKQYQYGATAAGMQSRGMTTDQVAAALLPALRQAFISSGGTVQGMQAQGLQNFGSIEFFRQLAGMSPDELREAQRGFTAHRGTGPFGLDLPKDVQESWVKLARQFNLAGDQIETSLIKHLVAVGPKLGELSEKVVNLVDIGLTKLEPALERLANWIDRITGNATESTTPATGGAGATQAAPDAVERFMRWGRKHTFGDTSPSPSGGVPNDIDLVRRLEGSGDSAVSPKGAVGRYQITPDTADTYGLDRGRLKDPGYSQFGASVILGDLRNRYHGDLAEILAAYNAGPGVGDRFAKSGNRLSTLPRETQNYLMRAQAMAPTEVHITVDNKTGFNVNINAKTLSPPT